MGGFSHMRRIYKALSLYKHIDLYLKQHDIFINFCITMTSSSQINDKLGPDGCTE